MLEPLCCTGRASGPLLLVTGKNTYWKHYLCSDARPWQQILTNYFDSIVLNSNRYYAALTILEFAGVLLVNGWLACSCLSIHVLHDGRDKVWASSNCYPAGIFITLSKTYTYLQFLPCTNHVAANTTPPMHHYHDMFSASPPFAPSWLACRALESGP